ncbi:hypothetical protein COCSADRAFT_353145, partial [Bipolaris sorokiniana ND90Pr]
LFFRHEKTTLSKNRNITSIVTSHYIYEILKILLFITFIIESYFATLFPYT